VIIDLFCNFFHLAMPARYLTRPERLAEERRKKAQEERVSKPRLNAAFPYVAIPYPSADLGTRPLWTLDGFQTSED